MQAWEPNPSNSAAKTAVRDQFLTARNRLSVAEIGACARAIAEVAAVCDEVRRATTVAAYVSIGSEPGTGPLLAALAAAGKRVILPVLQPDNDLDWAVFTGELSPARRGLLEPPGDRLGVDAVCGADLVLVPGVAMSSRGNRIGRGGGSYDRALARVASAVAAGAPPVEAWVVLYENEVGVDVPTETHDQPVTGALTPAGLVRVTNR